MSVLFRTGALVFLIVSVVLTTSVSAHDHVDHKQAIEEAVQKYVSAIYDMKPELIDESVSPKLQKLGYMPAEDGSGLAEGWMNFDQLKELAATINKDGMFDPATSPRDVEIIHHTDTIANVKLDAAWGFDYIHLTRHSGKWMIINVIWEMPTE